MLIWLTFLHNQTQSLQKHFFFQNFKAEVIDRRVKMNHEHCHRRWNTSIRAFLDESEDE